MATKIGEDSSPHKPKLNLYLEERLSELVSLFTEWMDEQRIQDLDKKQKSYIKDVFLRPLIEEVAAYCSELTGDIY